MPSGGSQGARLTGPMAEPAARSPVPTSEDRPQVIYVMGAGRSGSTILGVTLGNYGDVFYAGELDGWLVRSGEPQMDDAARVRFWSSVRERVDGAAELFGRTAELSLERSMSLFRIHRWRDRRRIRGPYRRVAEDLYRAVSRVAGTPLIVDTSHYPLRARELQALDGIDLYLVYLMRDPQSVVASFNRKDVAQYTKSTLTTNVYLWLTNLLCVWVFMRSPRDRRIVVRHEDFVADPQSVVRDVLRCVGVAAPPPDFAALDTGVAFQGNRVIRSARAALKSEPERPRRRSAITTVLQLPWALVLSRLRPVASTSHHD
ncbi:MAG: putative sulfotransferase protein [Solirubrobacterales bacterium]|nr:putative sulfotransferase protein [Solirubrobacterales bacterium]